MEISQNITQSTPTPHKQEQMSDKVMIKVAEKRDPKHAKNQQKTTNDE